MILMKYWIKMGCASDGQTYEFPSQPESVEPINTQTVIALNDVSTFDF